jgi:hypothetical protein
MMEGILARTSVIIPKTIPFLSWFFLFLLLLFLIEACVWKKLSISFFEETSVPPLPHSKNLSLSDSFSIIGETNAAASLI